MNKTAHMYKKQKGFQIKDNRKLLRELNTSSPLKIILKKNWAHNPKIIN